MRNPICVSTGSMYKLLKDSNDGIEMLRKFSFTGIELSFRLPEDLLDFKINKDNLKYLQALRFNSIHAPWYNIVYSDNKKCKETLRRISELYKQINAKNVVFHKNEIEDYNVITDSDFVASIENDDWRKPNNTIGDIKGVLDNNRKFKLTLDFAHALATSSDVSEYVGYFKDRLIEIHISIILDRKVGSHTFLHKHDSREIRYSIQPLKIVDVPLVLECTALDLNEIGLLKKEIDFLKKI